MQHSVLCETLLCIVYCVLCMLCTAYFHNIWHQPSVNWVHCRSAHWTILFVACCLVHSASYLSRKANRVATYQRYCCRVNTAEQKKLCLQVVALWSTIGISELICLTLTCCYHVPTDMQLMNWYILSIYNCNRDSWIIINFYFEYKYTACFLLFISSTLLGQWCEKYY